ncbi:hypothetical protein A3770_02p18270 [Chloropicon primus]|uniref:Uncharacterized protein n=1 Tax=Chloropicon primus TaxID=1764295 RepID=A0A5B8MFX2_9CHLO|nr:hypothetical protein A3770_02p18270 [Chloropicon primus]|eukprot:QDZ19309.1 hypothetical protein A3770_02p18270 [Chloropicon primus]
MATTTRSTVAAVVLAALVVAPTAFAAMEPHCEQYAFKSRDLQVDKPMDHTEIAAIGVGDMKQISEVFVTTKLLVKQFNGVKLSVDVVPPGGALDVPEKTVVLKNELRNNPNFLIDHLKPLKLEVIWRDDAPLTLGEALTAMKMNEIRQAKREFVQITARPDTSLKHLVRGISTNAGNGGSKGTWELRLENKSFKNREHVRLMNWDLTLCFDENEALANESHESILHDPVSAAAVGDSDDVIFSRTFGAPGRLGANLPRFAPRRRPIFGSSAFGAAAEGETAARGGLFGMLRPQALVPQETTRPFRLFRLWRRTDGNK